MTKQDKKAAATKTFTVAGSSVFFGVLALRFANDLASRTKTLKYYGHENIKLHVLPRAMTKEVATKWLRDNNKVASKAVMPSKAVYAEAA